MCYPSVNIQKLDYNMLISIENGVKEQFRIDGLRKLFN